MTTTRPLSATAGTALYVGALLGPSLLLLPGLAARIAGPASLLAWAGLLGVSALLARMFVELGRRQPDGGAVAYVRAGIGPRAGAAIGACFLTGVILGAPVVCLIGAGYLARLLGAGHVGTVGLAAGLLALVLVVTSSGGRVGPAVQLGLVGLLLALIAAAVLGSAPHAHRAAFAPFTPHGWGALGPAAAALMFAFVGWEAVAPLVGRLREPARTLPRVVTTAFGITAVVYLGLAVATIAVLGRRAGTAVPIAELLAVAFGPVGLVVAAVAAVVLTLAATNAYITGAIALAGELWRPAARHRLVVPAAIAVTGTLLLIGYAAGVVSAGPLVTLPTAMFVTVYLGCAVAAARLFTGLDRWLARVSVVAVALPLAFSGWSLLAVAAVVATTVALPKLIKVAPHRHADDTPKMCAVGP